MNSLPSMPQLRRASLLAVAIFFAAGVTYGQSSTSGMTSSDPSYSSSQAGLSQTELAEFSAPALPGGSAMSAGGAAGQYGSSGGHSGFLHNRSWTFEAGGGFSAPIGNDTGNGAGTTTPVLSWGGNFTAGGGLRFNKRFSALAEYQFIDAKLPGAFISAVGTSSGDAHFNSITGSPVIDLFPKRSNGIYLVGGWGWYHKSTNFNDYVCCDLYGYEVSENVLSIASNQWGGNAGFGLYHRLGNLYGDTGHSELFAEARYTFVNTPKPEINSSNVDVNDGFGTTELIPVTFGIRF